MPRQPRVALGGLVYHVLNRANARRELFESGGDYAAFEDVLRQAHEKVRMRTLAYCVMPNHWHLVLWPWEDGDLSAFMQWMTLTHTQRWHAAHQTTGTGHLYQSRFKGFPVQSDRHYLTVCRYVERNALRAGLVGQAEDWHWGSLWTRVYGDPDHKALLSNGPRAWPAEWIKMVNSPQNEAEESALRKCVQRERPYGEDAWVLDTAKKLGIEQSLRPLGRPKRA
jgi:putative transposase